MQLATSSIPSQSATAQEVLAGLSQEPKAIAPKYFYDRRGSELFSAITNLDEYYIPAAEQQIMRDNRTAICDRISKDRAIVEPGAGSCEKIRWLLPQLEPSVYVPMDISASHLASHAAALREDFPNLDVQPLACDHSGGVDIPELSGWGDPVFFYPGSSIGNFEPKDVVGFLRSMRAVMDGDGGLLIGVDAKKDHEVLRQAYNDSQGVTAEFNLNVLAHLNELLGGDFRLNDFEHVALYNEALGRIEMHLRCTRDHEVTLAGALIRFREGELVHTENSYKYDPAEFIDLAGEASLAHDATWQDAREYFSLMLFRAN